MRERPPLAPCLPSSPLPAPPRLALPCWRGSSAASCALQSCRQSWRGASEPAPPDRRHCRRRLQCCLRALRGVLRPASLRSAAVLLLGRQPQRAVPVLAPSSPPPLPGPAAGFVSPAERCGPELRPPHPPAPAACSPGPRRPADHPAISSPVAGSRPPPPPPPAPAAPRRPATHHQGDADHDRGRAEDQLGVHRQLRHLHGARRLHRRAAALRLRRPPGRREPLAHGGLAAPGGERGEGGRSEASGSVGATSHTQPRLAPAAPRRAASRWAAPLPPHLNAAGVGRREAWVRTARAGREVEATTADCIFAGLWPGGGKGSKDGPLWARGGGATPANRLGQLSRLFPRLFPSASSNSLPSPSPQRPGAQLAAARTEPSVQVRGRSCGSPGQGLAPGR